MRPVRLPVRPRSLAIGATALALVLPTVFLSAPAGAAIAPHPSSTSPSAGSGTSVVAPLVVSSTDLVTPELPGAPSITGLKSGLQDRALTVTYAPPLSDGGSPIIGYEVTIDDGMNWYPCPVTGTCVITNLSNGKRYTVIMRALNSIGPGARSAPVMGRPTAPPGTDPDKPVRLPKPRVWVNATFNAAGNGLGVDWRTTRLGVGALPRITFTRAIPNKAAVERHLEVIIKLEDGTTKKVKGAWGWIDDRTAVFRPKKYWPGHARITVISTLDRTVLGKDGNKWLVGSNKLATTWTFKTARKMVITVNGATTRMRVYKDGKLIKDFPVSLGKPGWESRNGVKVITTQKEPTHTYTSQSLGLGPEEEYELVAPWNTRLTPTGEFIHTAQWAYGRIGRYNGSHGCTNMFESDAKWIYDNTIPGDPVIYKNTGGSTVQSWNGAGGMWNIPWEDWLKKSALYDPTPDTSDPSRPTGDTGPEASA